MKTTTIDNRLYTLLMTLPAGSFYYAHGDTFKESSLIYIPKAAS